MAGFDHLDANYYHQHSEIQETLAMEMLKNYQFNPTHTLLDIGCGDGRVTAYMAKQLSEGSAKGIDPSAIMIDFARKNSQLSNLNFEVEMAEAFHGEAVYDVITLFNCLHWVRDVKNTFKYCARALKPQGELLILTYPRSSIYWQAFIDTLQTAQWKEHYLKSFASSLLTTEGYVNLAKQYDLSIIHCKEIMNVVEFQSIQDLEAYILGWLSCTIDVSESLLNLSLKDVLKVMANKYGTEHLKIPYAKLQLQLKKN